MRPRPHTDGVCSPLAQLPVLALDCQSTGAPASGHLLEIAWSALPPAQAQPAVASSCVALPEGARLSRRIRALTGIEPSDLVGAPSARVVWQRLSAAVGGRPLVAHFARFERAYLEALHAEHGGGGPFPLQLICTHEIVCRLMPGLPRRGLRAVAGRIGHVLHGPRRAAAHVRATAAIWAHVARQLAREADVHSLDELHAWLASVPATRRAGRDFAVERAARLDLPDEPGIYRLRARGGDVLYVGKATSLKRRVNSYFQKRRHDVERTPELLAQVFDVDVQRTASALEAALLESDEIKRRAPPYNRALLPRSPDVWYVREDLADVRATPDAAHAVGPLPEREGADAFAALRRLLDGSASGAEDWRCALGVRGDTPMDAACLSPGLTLFRERHGARLDATRLRRLGAQLWRRQQVRNAERKATRAVAARKKGTRPKRDWTVRRPEQVAGRLEGTVLRFAHWMRRAAWFTRLSECALRWQPSARGADDPARLVVFERGRLAHAADVAPTDILVAPPGADRPGQARRAAFDTATYDRLRVLTTEIRRLVVAGTRVDVCLSAQRTLDRAGLARRLRWL